MSFLSRLFGNGQPLKECPRCLGKGHVDWDDIKRLKQELKWMPGTCAYCNGKGKINPKVETNVPVDTTYLVTNLPEEEKKRYSTATRMPWNELINITIALRDFSIKSISYTLNAI